MKSSTNEEAKRDVNLRQSESRDNLKNIGGSRLDVNLSPASTRTLEALIMLRGEVGIKGAKKGAVEEALEIALRHKEKVLRTAAQRGIKKVAK